MSKSIPNVYTPARLVGYSNPKHLCIPRATILALTLKFGKFNCRDRAQAKSCVQQALGLGVSIDMYKMFDGEWYTLLSAEGVDSLKAKHGYIAPHKRRIKWKGKRSVKAKAKVMPLDTPEGLVQRTNELMRQRYGD